MKRWNTLREAISEGDTFSAFAEEDEMSENEILNLAENAVKNGKYLFAAKAYERAYGEEWKDKVLEKHIKNMTNSLSSGDLENAVRESIIASSLNAPIRPYQSKGLELHKSCGSQSCILQESDLNKVADLIFQYFLNHDKILEILGKQDIELKKGFIKLLAREHDLDLDDFLSRFSYMVETLRKGIDEYIALRSILADEEKKISGIPGYDFSPDEVKELQNIRFSGEDEIETSEVKEKVNSLLRKLRELDNSGLMAELDGILDGKGEPLPPLFTFREAEVQSEYESSLKEEMGNHGKLVMESSERIIWDIFELASEEYSSEISRSIFSRSIDFLKQLIQLKSDLLASNLRHIYGYSQRILLGRKTGADAYWQYLKELSVSHPISVFLVCIMPNAFLKNQNFPSDDILREIQEITESDRFVVPIIREGGMTMAEFLEIE